jgi:hypothetical protein
LQVLDTTGFALAFRALLVFSEIASLFFLVENALAHLEEQNLPDP